MITFPATIPPSGVAAPAPLLAPAPLSSSDAVEPVAPAVVESTSVELSRLSLFMSSLALARKRLADQRVAAAAAPGERVAATELADIEAAGQALAEAFNVLRASEVEAARTPADVLLEEQLLQTFTQPEDNSAAALFTLPQVIPAVQPTPADVEAARLRVDLPALRTAANAAPEQTLSRLERTTEQFAELAAALAATPAAPQRYDADVNVDANADAAAIALQRAATEAALEAERVERERAATLQADAAEQKRLDLQRDMRLDAAAAQNRVADMALADLFAENHNTPPPVTAAAASAADAADAGQAPPQNQAEPTPVVTPRPDIDHAEMLARDPAVAAALAAYHINQGPFRTATNLESAPAPAGGAKVAAVAPVRAVTPVAPIGAIGDARTDAGPRT